MKASRLVVSAAVLACSMSGANAQPLPPESKFNVTYTVVNVAPIKPISIGKDVDMTVSSSVMTAVNDAGSGLLHNLAGRCLMSSITDRATKTFEQHGYCSYIDADGDQIFEKVDFDRQALAPVIVAKGQWIGGTGKYMGAEGAIEIRHTPMKSATEGAVQGSGKKIGSYTLKPM